MLGAPWTSPPPWWSLDGRPMRVQVPATTRLAAAIATPDDKGAGLYTVIECTAPGDRWWIFHQIVEAGLDVDVLDEIADTLVERIVGRKRWEAAYLWRHTLGSWPEIDGDLTGRGVDLAELPAARATNVVHAWWRRNLQNADAWNRFIREMEREPVRVIEREADQPMDPAVFGQLHQLGAPQPRPAKTPTVPESTIVMPDQIP